MTIMNHHCKDWMKHPRQSFVKYMHSLHFFILIIFLERHNNIIDQLKEFDSSYTLRVDKPQNAQEGESESISLSSLRLLVKPRVQNIIFSFSPFQQLSIKLRCLLLYNSQSMQILKVQDTWYQLIR